jgi:hypothetical protein
MQACGSILNELPPEDRGGPVTPQNDPAMMRRFAACMRAHGIADWPDPNADGDFPLPPSLASSIKGGPRLPQVLAARNGCRQYDPSGHISYVQA